MRLEIVKMSPDEYKIRVFFESGCNEVSFISDESFNKKSDAISFAKEKLGDLCDENPIWSHKDYAFVCAVCGHYICDKVSMKDLDSELPAYCPSCDSELDY